MLSCSWESVHCSPTATQQDLVPLCFPAKVQAPPSQVLQPVRVWTTGGKSEHVEDKHRSGRASSPALSPLEPHHLCPLHNGQLYCAAQVRCRVHFSSAAASDGQGQLTLSQNPRASSLFCRRYGAGITAKLTPSQDRQVVVSSLPYSCPCA